MYSSDKQDSNKVWYGWFQVVIIFDSVQSSDHICIKSIWQLMPEPNIENTAATHIAAPRHEINITIMSDAKGEKTKSKNSTWN